MKKGQNGITLVALVITIIVMLILAGVTVTLALDNGGIFGQAMNAATQTNNAAQQETNISQGYVNYNGNYTSLNDIVNGI